MPNICHMFVEIDIYMSQYEWMANAPHILAKYAWIACQNWYEWYKKN